VRDLYDALDRQEAAGEPDQTKVPDEARFGEEEFAEELRGGNTRMLVAEWDGEVVGFVAASIRFPEKPWEAEHPWGSIDDVIVRADLRERGIGRQLLTAAEAWARERGAPEIRLSVGEYNRDAIRLYERLGFETIRRQMRKRLVD
jgi:ribosomal protein S18 acetylase RimI-like enzyme